MDGLFLLKRNGWRLYNNFMAWPKKRSAATPSHAIKLLSRHKTTLKIYIAYPPGGTLGWEINCGTGSLISCSPAQRHIYLRSFVPRHVKYFEARNGGLYYFSAHFV